MPRFMIEVPHSPDKSACLKAVHIFLKTGSHYVSHCEWGCLDGEHKAWITVETDTRDQAMQVVPPAFQKDAKITQLSRFSLEQLESILGKHAE